MTYYNELYHYGVPGMKWGVRKQKELIGRSYNNFKSKVLLKNKNTISKAERRKRLKRNLKIGATVAAAGLAIYAGYKLNKIYNNRYNIAKNLISKSADKARKRITEKSNKKREYIKLALETKRDWSIAKQRIKNAKEEGKIVNDLIRSSYGEKTLSDVQNEMKRLKDSGNGIASRAVDTFMNEHFQSIINDKYSSIWRG